ncbi:hypothetical protein J4471_00740 [Candidatus Woesearchaeota archaeon]|nr:hypothetical protein [Candidatus Woesearchaeota archaeon]
MAKLTLSHKLGYKLSRAVDCDLTELESALDYCAPPSERKGYWPHNPEVPDPVEAYIACYETLRGIDPDTEKTIAQYVERALADEEDSSEIFGLVKTLAKYLLEHKSEEKQK